MRVYGECIKRLKQSAEDLDTTVLNTIPGSPFLRPCQSSDIEMSKLSKNDPKYHTTMRLRKSKDQRPPSQYTAYKPPIPSTPARTKHRETLPRTQHTHTNECVYWGCQHEANTGNALRHEKRGMASYRPEGRPPDVPLSLAPGHSSGDSYRSQTRGDGVEEVLDGCTGARRGGERGGSGCCVVQ